MQLPTSAQEIANVIGREQALFLIGQLPRCYVDRPGHKSWRVIMYVPKTLKAEHDLVRLLGWHDARKLVQAFGGEILQPASCHDVYRKWRDANIIRLHSEGMKPAQIAELMEVSDRQVRNLVREKTQEEQNC